MNNDENFSPTKGIPGILPVDETPESSGKKCVLCHRPNALERKLGICTVCGNDFIYRHPSISEQRFLQAARLGRSEIMFKCETHGETSHAVKGRSCLKCFPDGRERVHSDRAVARNRGDAFYRPNLPCSENPDHINALFSVRTGRCSECYTEMGARRRVSGVTSARSEARLSGSLYEGVCERCGPSKFHPNSGRCFTCYTATGAARRRAVSPRQINIERLGFWTSDEAADVLVVLCERMGFTAETLAGFLK